MREHCKTQHKYDPCPNIGSQKGASNIGNGTRSVIGGSSSSQQNKVRVPLAVERFMSMMTESLKFRELAIGNTTPKSTRDLMSSPESTINYMLDNYVIVRKRLISGISGYFCKKCLTFQFQYIKDIGFDLTAEERHRCMVDRVSQVDSLQDRGLIQNHLYSESIQYLLNLTNSIFTDKKRVIVRSNFMSKHSETNHSRIQSFNVRNFHAPVIRMNFITPSHWAWSPIKSGKLGLTGTGLEEIIRNVGGTFAIILIQKGELSGYHLLWITRLASKNERNLSKLV